MPLLDPMLSSTKSLYCWKFTRKKKESDTLKYKRKFFGVCKIYKLKYKMYPDSRGRRRTEHRAFCTRCYWIWQA